MVLHFAFGVIFRPQIRLAIHTELALCCRCRRYILTIITIFLGQSEESLKKLQNKLASSAEEKTVKNSTHLFHSSVHSIDEMVRAINSLETTHETVFSGACWSNEWFFTVVIVERTTRSPIVY